MNNCSPSSDKRLRTFSRLCTAHIYGLKKEYLRLKPLDGSQTTYLHDNHKNWWDIIYREANKQLTSQSILKHLQHPKTQWCTNRIHHLSKKQVYERSLQVKDTRQRGRIVRDLWWWNIAWSVLLTIKCLNVHKAPICSDCDIKSALLIPLLLACTMISLVTRSLREDMRELRRLKCISEFFGISKPVLELISELQYFYIQFRYLDTSNRYNMFGLLTGELKMVQIQWQVA